MELQENNPKTQSVISLKNINAQLGNTLEIDDEKIAESFRELLNKGGSVQEIVDFIKNNKIPIKDPDNARYGKIQNIVFEFSPLSNAWDNYREAIRIIYNEKKVNNDDVEIKEKRQPNTQQNTQQGITKELNWLPYGLPIEIYDLDNTYRQEQYGFKYKIDEYTLKEINKIINLMRKNKIITFRTKEGGIYTTITLPEKEPINFFEIDLKNHSDENFLVKENDIYALNNGKYISKYEVKLGGMKGKIYDWKNKKLAEYIKGINNMDLPYESDMMLFKNEIIGYINTYLDISYKFEKYIITRLLTSCGKFRYKDYIDGFNARPYFCYDGSSFHSPTPSKLDFCIGVYGGRFAREDDVSAHIVLTDLHNNANI